MYVHHFLYKYALAFHPVPSSVKTATVGTRVTGPISASDQDPGLNGTIRFNLVQRIPDAAFVSLLSVCVCVCVCVCICMYSALIWCVDPPTVLYLG